MDRGPALKFDVEAIRARCGLGSLSGQACYERFSRLGLSYGPGHRGLRQLWQAENEVLGQIRLPQQVRPQADRYGLHPSVLDAAFQACLGFYEGQSTSAPLVPFALESVQLERPCQDAAWVWVEREPAQTHKYRLSLLDAQGEVLVSLKGFMARALVKPARGVHTLRFTILINDRISY